MTTPARVNGGALPVVTTGRDLAMYTITLTSVETGYSAVDSDFEKLVRAIETIGTVEILGTPATNAFRVAIKSLPTNRLKDVRNVKEPNQNRDFHWKAMSMKAMKKRKKKTFLLRLL